jgi:hypothetical protein
MADSPTKAKVYANMAKLYEREGKHRKAKKMADKADSFRATAALLPEAH